MTFFTETAVLIVETVTGFRAQETRQLVTDNL